MENSNLANLLFPDVTLTCEQIEERYPQRNLPEGSKVTRIAPSPTGFMHLGNLYGALVDERLAHQSGGVFYLRIEDTDLKRAVENGVETINNAFNSFGLHIDEGAQIDGEKGNYGPYYQRKRAEIYHVFAKQLILMGRAYPCFCSEDELSEMREHQEAEKANFGYYGKWAVHREMPFEEVKRQISNGVPYVLRFKSMANINSDTGCRFKMKDLIKGDIDMPQNDQDFVLLKSDGIPTYHFAHVVDDHLMRTTHVVRGEEWLATLPFHIELFDTLGFKRPNYAHTAQLMKMDGNSKRKLSKRKDPELALDFYRVQGYPVRSVLEYLMTILNSNFEEWRLENPQLLFEQFPFSLNKMSASGSLFDLNKLNDISKNTISMMSADEVYNEVTDWAKVYDKEFHKLLTDNPEYAKSILAIGREGEKRRKDIALWGEVKEYMSFFYGGLFSITGQYPQNVSKEDAKEILTLYKDIFDINDDRTVWFDKIRALAVQLNFAAKPKDYKKEPEKYKGHVGDVRAVLRIAITGRENSPDMYDCMQILGKEKVLSRLKSATLDLE